jgi:thiamine-monophosphate kinase
VHFDLQLISWQALGWKSLAVNLSDLAAMGATPAWGFVTLALRGDTRVQDVLDLYGGMAALGERSGCTIAGGDTAGTPGSQTIGVTVLGTVAADDAMTLLRRDAGRPGDAVAVTGTLGGSAAGLYALQHPDVATPAQREVLGAVHLRPQPQLAAGATLRTVGVRCAMDLSDGLLADTGKLCAASGTGAVLHQDLLPVHPVARDAFPAQALSWAASGGEDYQLLFAAPKSVMQEALAALQAQCIQVTEIGELNDDRGRVRLLDGDGREVHYESGGWDHFGGGSSDRR